MGLKVAIVGLAPSTYEQAPWDDKSWEKWGMPWDTAGWTRMDRLFEPHDIKFLRVCPLKSNPDFFDRLRDCQTLYMQSECAEVPNAIAYPSAEVSKTIGGQYLNSTVAYMLALAVHEGAEEIGLWGVDMDLGSEYFMQRPNAEYLIGLARGRGIKVHIPDESPLCKFIPDSYAINGEVVWDVDRYGWLG